MKTKFKNTITKTFLLLLISSSFCSLSIAQVKTKEVDVLYQKYKNRDSVTVTNATGTVDLAVKIILNANGKPQSIILMGYAENLETADGIIRKLKSDKEKAGFKYSSSSTEYALEILSVAVYTKGTQYAKYGVITKIEKDEPPYETGTEEQKTKREKAYLASYFKQFFIYMEVGDISRKLNDKSDDFKF